MDLSCFPLTPLWSPPPEASNLEAMLSGAAPRRPSFLPGLEDFPLCVMLETSQLRREESPPTPRARLSFLADPWRVWSLNTCHPGPQASEEGGRRDHLQCWLRTKRFLCTLLGMFCETGLYSVGIFLGSSPKHSLPGGGRNQFVNNSQKKKRPGQIAEESRGKIPGQRPQPDE